MIWLNNEKLNIWTISFFISPPINKSHIRKRKRQTIVYYAFSLWTSFCFCCGWIGNIKEFQIILWHSCWSDFFVVHVHIERRTEISGWKEGNCKVLGGLRGERWSGRLRVLPLSICGQLARQLRLSGQRPRRSGGDDSGHHLRNRLENIFANSLNRVFGRIHRKAWLEWTWTIILEKSTLVAGSSFMHFFALWPVFLFCRLIRMETEMARSQTLGMHSTWSGW